MSVLILGAGYVGSRLKERLPDAIATRRSPGPGELRFDLLDESTWSALPRAESVVWTFPPLPVEATVRLCDGPLRLTSNLIVLGSTSAYRATDMDGSIDEESPLDPTQDRVLAEETLKRRGATILSLAGIWGPGRDPIGWLRGGRIRSGAKFVNLAHIDDILTAIQAVLRTPRPGQRLNVSDGEPRRWREHVASLRADGRLEPSFEVGAEAAGADSKRIRNDRLRALLPANHTFTRLT